MFLKKNAEIAWERGIRRALCIAMSLEDYWLLAVVLAGVLSALNAALNFSLHQIHLRRASGLSKVASATLNALRQAEIHEYPPQRHKWSVTARKEKQTPILCVECTDTIKPLIIASTVRRVHTLRGVRA